ncbi:MAG: hypothetical protein IAA96_07475 [Spirochaetes bacterium]|uniref:Uncharacterized protein n=1 Tax=Candidatus Avitreponema avistercoris TaxID=2840705 RepID=A0A9D9HH62_9SPIR|nr:hypothetical protein [Candidatus Avitreponema avistercoris]
MKTYYIMGAKGHSCLTILNETDAGFMTRIYKDEDGWEETIDDFLSRDLFEMCVRTGYLVEAEEKKAEASA